MAQKCCKQCSVALALMVDHGRDAVQGSSEQLCTSLVRKQNAWLREACEEVHRTTSARWRQALEEWRDVAEDCKQRRIQRASLRSDAGSSAQWVSQQNGQRGKEGITSSS